MRISRWLGREIFVVGLPPRPQQTRKLEFELEKKHLT